MSTSTTPPLRGATSLPAVAWFRYAGWLSVSLDDHTKANPTAIAISPRTATTPHWIFDLGGDRSWPVGGGWSLPAAIVAASRLCAQCGGQFWREDLRRSWASLHATDEQTRLLEALGANKLELTYARRNRGQASGMIGFLQARRRLQAAGWWWTAHEGLPPAEAALWAADELLGMLQEQWLPVATRFADAAAGPGPAPLPWVPTAAATALAAQLAEGQGHAILVNDGGGLSRALGELRGHEGWVRCDLANVGGARRQLMTIAAALVGGDPLQRGGTTMDVGEWLMKLLACPEAPRTLILDHCPPLSVDILHWINRALDATARVIFVVKTQAEAERLRAQLRRSLAMLPYPLLPQAELERSVLPHLLNATGLRCAPDEHSWVADELWTWLHQGAEGMRWRHLARVTLRLAEPGRLPAGEVDQAAVQRLRATWRAGVSAQ